MPWGRLDDSLYDHPKLDRLGLHRLNGVGLWAVAISWSNRRLTDGFVPTERIRLLGGTRAIAEKLVEAELFELAEGGYLVHDFLEFNDSRADVEARREADRERKRGRRGLRPEGGPESGGSPRGVQPEPTADSAGSPPGTRARPHDRPRPGPARPGPSRTESPPNPPPSGGRRSRANGTAPRQEAEREAEAKRYRAAQRDLAYHRGALTEAQLADMAKRDAPLEEIPDWAEHQRRLAAESDPPGLGGEA